MSVQLQRDPRIRFDLSPSLMERWKPEIRAAAEDDQTISILDPIGADFWGEGTTAKRIGAALRSIGAGKSVTVNLNSPGGDFFEGLAIYNQLKQHDGEITVNVLGLAASAASVIAMAADQLNVARAGFLMIHNTWVLAVGNRHDLIEVADTLEHFDQVSAELYAARSGLPESEIAELMDAESWISGTQALEMGFADALLDSDQLHTKPAPEQSAALTMDIALAKAGLSRSERRKLFKQFKSRTQDAAGAGTQSAAGDTPRAIEIKADPLPRLHFSRV